MKLVWTWSLVPLIVALFAVQTCALVSKENQVADLRKATEAATLRADGLAVAERVSQRQLREAIEDADALREQIAQAPRGSEVKEVVRWKTKSTPIPLPTECPGSSSPPNEPGSATSPPSPAPFSVRLEGTQASLQTKAGALFVVGSVDVIQVTPEPEKVLATLPWEADATRYLTAAPPAKRRSGWGLGPAVGLVDGSWVYGAAATGPAIGGRVALQPAAWALAGDGHWSAASAVMITW